MILYKVTDAGGKIVGETTNVQELNQFLATHPGHLAQPLRGAVIHPRSTLPRLQEEPGKPKGDLLQQ